MSRRRTRGGRLDPSLSPPVGSVCGPRGADAISDKEGGMVAQRKRRRFFGLGLVLALVLAASPASASAVDSLTGQVLSGSGGPDRVVCQTGGPFSYTVSGT